MPQAACSVPARKMTAVNRKKPMVASPADEHRRRRKISLPCNGEDDRKAVQHAPQDEAPCRAVPQPAERHRHDDRSEMLRHPKTPSPKTDIRERDEQIVAQKPRQGHVPALPELLDARRPERGVEALRQLHSKK